MGKKSIVFGVVLLVTLAALNVCSNTGASNVSKDKAYTEQYDDNETGISVQYIRTNGYRDGVVYPIITVISSKNELEQYYDNYKDKYYLGQNFNRSIDIDDEYFVPEFIEAIEVYSDNFFADNFLIIVLLEEGSGSIRHKVKTVDENGHIVIKRLIPEIGTADMAQWHIIIQCNNNIKAEQYQVQIQDHFLK